MALLSIGTYEVNQLAQWLIDEVPRACCVLSKSYL